MGCPVPVHCRQCGEALDVYGVRPRRFCCSGCEEEFRYHNPGVIERDEAAEARADV